MRCGQCSGGSGECVVKHTVTHFCENLVALPYALLRWVFSHTTQGASHPPGRPHYSSFIIQCLQARVAYLTVSD